jgi:hypothetical protein
LWRAGFRGRNWIGRHVTRELIIGRTARIIASGTDTIYRMSDGISSLQCNPSVIHMDSRNKIIFRPMWVA